MSAIIFSAAWLALALWMLATGKGATEFLACIIMASIWAAAHQIIREIRKGC